MRKSTFFGVSVVGLLVAVGLSAWACGSSSEEPTAAETPEPAPEPPPDHCAPDRAASATDTVTDPAFELRATTSGAYAQGQEGRFQIALTPRGEYHVNSEYPMGIRVEGPTEVAFPSAEIPRERAVEYGEPRARFEVPFTASATGQHRVVARVDFAVCTPETCMPDCRTLALVLPVEAAAPAAGPADPAMPAPEGATATP